MNALLAIQDELNGARARAFGISLAVSGASLGRNEDRALGCLLEDLEERLTKLGTMLDAYRASAEAKPTPDTPTN